MKDWDKEDADSEGEEGVEGNSESEDGGDDAGW